MKTGAWTFVHPYPEFVKECFHFQPNPELAADIPWKQNGVESNHGIMEFRERKILKQLRQHCPFKLTSLFIVICSSL